MSQVETQSRPQSGNKPVVNSQQQQNGDQKRGPKRQGSGNRFDGPKPQRTGGDRPVGKGRGNGQNANNRPFSNKDSKTLYIGRVFTDDLDGSVLSEKLKDQRIKHLRDALEQLGPVDAFEVPVGEGYVLVSYETHEVANNALRALKDDDAVDGLLSRLREKINQSKLPTAVLPDLLRYRYSWSERQASSGRSRSNKLGLNSSLPKNVVANAKKPEQSSPATPQQPTPQQSQPQAQQQQPKAKKERKPKQEVEQQQQEQPVEQPAPVQTQQQPKPKKSQQQQQVQQQQQIALSPKTQQGADNLQREAERARLSQDLIYLQEQQTHVTQELTAESDRCRARDERINRLSEELNRVRQQEQFLESQLKSEQKWKTDAEERISKLTEEVNHFAQEQKQVEARLSVVAQQLKANGL